MLIYLFPHLNILWTQPWHSAWLIGAFSECLWNNEWNELRVQSSSNTRTWKVHVLIQSFIYSTFDSLLYTSFWKSKISEDQSSLFDEREEKFSVHYSHSLLVDWVSIILTLWPWLPNTTGILLYNLEMAFFKLQVVTH